VRKTKFGLATLPGDLEDNVSAIPLGLVFDKVDAGLWDMPYDLLSWHPFGDLVGAEVKFFVVELKFSTEFVSSAFDFFRPPSTNVVDGIEDFFRGLIYRYGSGVILVFFHGFVFFWLVVKTFEWPNDQKLSHADRQPAQQCKNGNRISWLGQNWRGSRRWLQRCVRRLVVCLLVASRPRISEGAKHQHRNNRVSQMREPPRHPKPKLGLDITNARRAGRSHEQNSTNHAVLESHLLAPHFAA